MASLTVSRLRVMRRNLALTGLTVLLAACQPTPAATPPTTAPVPTAAPKPAVAPVASPSTAAAPSPSAAASPAAAASPVAAANQNVPGSLSPQAATAVALAPVAAANAALPAFSGPRTALKLSYSSNGTDNIPAWYAKDNGIYDRNGLDVELTNIASSTGIPAILSGEIQVGLLGGSEVMSVNANGADLVVFGAMSGIYPYVFMTPPDIKTKDDLKGKKIGVSNIGSSSDIATRVFLANIGLDAEKDVAIIAVGSLQNRFAALISGAIQGGLTQPPDNIDLLDKGYKVLYDLADLKLPSATLVYATTRAYATANRSVIQRVIDSSIQANVAMRLDRPGAIKVLSKYNGATEPRHLDAAYDFYVVQGVNQLIPVVQVNQWTDAIRFLGPQNPKIAEYNVAKMLDTSFIEDAVARGLAGKP